MLWTGFVPQTLSSYIWFILPKTTKPKNNYRLDLGVFMLYRSNLVVFTIHRILHNCETLHDKWPVFMFTA